MWLSSKVHETLSSPLAPLAIFMLKNASHLHRTSQNSYYYVKGMELNYFAFLRISQVILILLIQRPYSEHYSSIPNKPVLPKIIDKNLRVMEKAYKNNIHVLVRWLSGKRCSLSKPGDLSLILGIRR